MSANELPAGGNWEAVAAAVHQRAKRLEMSIASLSRLSGVSETTIRYLGEPVERQRSTLVALSAVLGCKPGYLEDVLLGQPPDNSDPRQLPPGIETRLDQITATLRSMAETLARMDTSLKTITGTGTTHYRLTIRVTGET